MMTFVNMDSDGLVILPTHRVVHSLTGFDPEAFAFRRRGVLHGRDACPRADAASYLELLARQEGTAFVAVTRAGALLLALQAVKPPPRWPICPNASASST
jgi:hypothetical protein